MTAIGDRLRRLDERWGVGGIVVPPPVDTTDPPLRSVVTVLRVTTATTIVVGLVTAVGAVFLGTGFAAVAGVGVALAAAIAAGWGFGRIQRRALATAVERSRSVDTPVHVEPAARTARIAAPLGMGLLVAWVPALVLGVPGALWIATGMVFGLAVVSSRQLGRVAALEEELDAQLLARRGIRWRRGEAFYVVPRAPRKGSSIRVG